MTDKPLPTQRTLGLSDVFALHMIAIYDLHTYLMKEPPLGTDMNAVYDTYRQYEVPKTVLKEMIKLVRGDQSAEVFSEIVRFIDQQTYDEFEHGDKVVEAFEFRWSCLGDLMRGKGENFDLICVTSHALPNSPVEGRYFAYYPRVNPVDCRRKATPMPDKPTIVNLTTMFRIRLLQDGFTDMLGARRRHMVRTAFLNGLDVGQQVHYIGGAEAHPHGTYTIQHLRWPTIETDDIIVYLQSERGEEPFRADYRHIHPLPDKSAK